MSARDEQAYLAVQRTLRAEMGKALGPLLKRWRYTQSSDFEELPLKPSTARFLIRYGLLDASQDDGERLALRRQFLTTVSRSCGDAPGIVAAWLDLFSEGEYGALEKGICADEPQCGKCGLKDKCRYLAAGGKEERVSGEHFAEKLLNFAERKLDPMSSSDLLAFLLTGEKSGGADYARAEAALKSCNGLRGLFEANAKTLRALGYDENTQPRLRAIALLCARWAVEQAACGKIFRQGKDFFDHFHLKLRDRKKEVFYVVLLDQKNSLIAEEQVSEGNLTETLVHPREVFSSAVSKLAAAVAVVHNHPSGDPKPSSNDISITKRLDSAAKLLGIRLLDHVIIGDGVYTSFVEKGLL